MNENLPPITEKDLADFAQLLAEPVMSKFGDYDPATFDALVDDHTVVEHIRRSALSSWQMLNEDLRDAVDRLAENAPEVLTPEFLQGYSAAATVMMYAFQDTGFADHDFFHNAFGDFASAAIEGRENGIGIEEAVLDRFHQREAERELADEGGIDTVAAKLLGAEEGDADASNGVPSE